MDSVFVICIYLASIFPRPSEALTRYMHTAKSWKALMKVLPTVVAL